VPIGNSTVALARSSSAVVATTVSPWPTRVREQRVGLDELHERVRLVDDPGRPDAVDAVFDRPHERRRVAALDRVVEEVLAAGLRDDALQAERGAHLRAHVDQPVVLDGEVHLDDAVGDERPPALDGGRGHPDGLAEFAQHRAVLPVERLRTVGVDGEHLVDRPLVDGRDHHHRAQHPFQRRVPPRREGGVRRHVPGDLDLTALDGEPPRSPLAFVVHPDADLLQVAVARPAAHAWHDLVGRGVELAEPREDVVVLRRQPLADRGPQFLAGRRPHRRPSDVPDEVDDAPERLGLLLLAGLGGPARPVASGPVVLLAVLGPPAAVLAVLGPPVVLAGRPLLAAHDTPWGPRVV
jgi:hypothetical protein